MSSVLTKDYRRSVSVAASIGCGILLLAAELSAAPLPAFPGAEGYGKYTSGGRGGDLYIVTSLGEAATGSAVAGKPGVYEGTFRYACEATGKRTVVFSVGGVIAVSNALKYINVTSPNITIAGETAPGDGIMLRAADDHSNACMQFLAGSVIMRNLKFRRGAAPVSGVSSEGKNIFFEQVDSLMIDHCSFTWATDENFSGNTVRYVTIQNCIVAEGLWNANHRDGPHSCGSVTNEKSTELLWYRNLFAHNNYRNPKLASGGAAGPGFTAHYGVVNNVIYNTGSNYTIIDFSHTTADQAPTILVNVIGNYYKLGADTDPVADWEVRIDHPAVPTNKAYLEGNIGPHRPNTSLPEGAVCAQIGDEGTASVHWVDKFDQADLPPYISATAAYDEVLAGVGAFGAVDKRDAVDSRIVNSVKNGSGAIPDAVSDVGGWPTMASGAPYPDSDRDGMDDTWETRKFGSLTAHDHNDFAPSGYTYLEEFLHELSGDPIGGPTGISTSGFARSIVLQPGVQKVLSLSSTNLLGSVSARVYDIRGVRKPLAARNHAVGVSIIVDK